MSSYYPNQRTVFQDGESITSTDLDAISSNTTRRAWEVPGYANLLGFDQYVAAGVDDYEDIFAGTFADGAYARSRGVFTKGGGLRPKKQSALASRLGAGMLGVWKHTGTIAPPAGSGASQMVWGWMSGGDGFNHDTESAGYKRWDVVSCYLLEADSTPISRDFEDSTTGVKTSETVVTSKVYTLAFSLTKGTHNTSSPTIPNVATGQYDYLCFAVLIDGDADGGPAITKVLDFTIPVGTMRKQLMMGNRAGYVGAGWVHGPSGEITTVADAGSRIAYVIPPDGVAGNGESRILGVRISHTLAAGSTIQVGSINLNGIGTPFTLDYDTTATCDGTARTLVINLSGYPGAHMTEGPYWGTGQQAKGQAQFSASFALQVTTPTPDGGGNILFSTEWFTLS